jgi:hypothetical protein
MQRTFRMAAAVTLLVAAGAAVAQAPAGTDLFPTKVGSKWVYKLNDQEVTVTVAGPEKVGADDGFKFDTAVGGAVKQSEVYLVKADGVYRAKVGDKKIEPPVKVLALPAKKDTTWDVDSKVGTEAIKGKFKVTDEKAKIKMGTTEYEAVAVEGPEFEIAMTKTAIKQWFVPGKGIVKVEYTIGTATTTMELKEFTEKK